MSYEPFSYSDKIKVWVDRCPACGSKERTWLRDGKDRYGFRVLLATCPCGLTYLVEQMTRAGYDYLYSGPYRRMVWQHNFPDRPFDLLESEHKLVNAQRDYARHLTGFLLHFDPPQHAKVLDAGGSTGVVSHELSKTFGFSTITVLDPSGPELALAKATTTVKGYLEDVIPNGPYDIILCCETMDHLTQPMDALRNMRKALKPGGLFFADIVDRQSWGVEDQRIKIDHPLYWTKKAFVTALEAAGFTIDRAVGHTYHGCVKTRAVCR